MTDRERLVEIIKESDLYTPGLSFDEDAADELSDAILQAGFVQKDEEEIRNYIKVHEDCVNAGIKEFKSTLLKKLGEMRKEETVYSTLKMDGATQFDTDKVYVDGYKQALSDIERLITEEGKDSTPQGNG